MDGYAQKTWYKWKEDETVKGNYDGCISISNQLLDASTDAYEFPFAASDGNIIPIVSWDSHKTGYSDNDFEEVDCEPRIMRLVDNYGRADLRFDFERLYSKMCFGAASEAAAYRQGGGSPLQSL